MVNRYAQYLPNYDATEIDRLRAENRRLKQIIAILFIGGTVTWLALMLG